MITIVMIIIICGLYYKTYKNALTMQCEIENPINPVTSPYHEFAKAFHEDNVKYCIKNKQLDFLRKTNSATKKVE